MKSINWNVSLSDRNYLEWIAAQPSFLTGSTHTIAGHIIFVVVGLPMFLIISGFMQLRGISGGKSLFYAYALLISLDVFFTLLFKVYADRLPLFNSKPKGHRDVTLMFVQSSDLLYI